jgi:EAL domain-containing protein (putative c-di-GMP-specific phosphodiesterase class I)
MTLQPEAARHPKRLRVEALERYADQLAARIDGPRPGLLAVGLSRGDRMRALARRPDTVELLASVLDRVEEALNPSDRYAVVAIDEIWVVLADAPGEGILRLAADTLRGLLDGFYASRFDDGTPVQVPVATAIGGAWIDVPLRAADDLVLAAGHAFSEARGTEDRIVIMRTSDDQRLVRARLAARIRGALDNNELEMWYQPQVRLSDRYCDAFEALVRWPQPEGAAMVSPALLVSICEESGLVGELTRFSVNSVLRQMMSWRALGFEPRIAINLSALTLKDTTFPNQVSQACELWGVDASRLVFELTESSIARNEQTTLDFMRRLRELGCELSIDDFGTGYSSFAYLRQFPVNELKIDRAFVREIATHPADQRIVKALIEVAHALGLRALAEGVEDPDGVEVLHRLGCDAIQGWHFAKAMRSDQVVEWTARFSGVLQPEAETIGME